MLLISIISIAAIGWILVFSPAEYVPESGVIRSGVILYEAERAPLDAYWRRITGYDSVQVYYGLSDKGYADKVTVNFCYPNEWDREKFKIDTVSIHDRAEKSMPRHILTFRDTINNSK